MAMSESTPAPPYGAVANKDNTHQGECESDDHQGNEEAPCDIDPADLEDGEILDDSDGEGTLIDKPTSMVNLENIILNNPIGSDSESKKKKKKRTKRLGGPNDEPSKKRKKFSDHSRSGDSEERTMSPLPRSRLKLKRHGDRHQEKSSFDEDLSGEERRHHKMGSKGSILQRLGERSASRIKGRSSSSSKLNLARKRAQMGRPPLRKRELRPKTICKFFLEGNCNKGEVCTFSHDTTPYKKKDLCKFYLHGYCTKEDACLFMHSEFPCKFFHTGAVCYADTDCRFSHKPLTEESRMLLDRYLDSGPKNDRRRDHSPPQNRMDRGRPPPPHLHGPPPPHHHHHHPNNNNMNDMKMRPSLLGSPPPHIKEAASEWQQDLMMQMHQHENSPPQMSRPNFYMDTMDHSPQRGPIHGNAPMNEMDSFQMGGPFPQTCGDVTPSQGGATPIPTDDEAEDLDDQMSFPQPMQRRFFPGPPHQHRLLPETEETISAAISAIRAESECQRTPPHLEAERSLSPTSRPDVSDQPPNLLAGSPPHESPTKVESKDELKEDSEEPGMDSSEGDQMQTPTDELPPLAFPSHLPRKQRELFMRIQQHQRLAKIKALGGGGGESSTDDNEDQIEEKAMKIDVVEEEIAKVVEAEKSEVKVKEESLLREAKKSQEEEEDDEEEEEEEDDEKPKGRWYSSDEDDDDNGDQPLTDVLKKLQQMPPPMAPPPTSTSATPAIDIAKMLSSIREQTTQQTGGLNSGLKSDFWQNILSATAPPANLPVPTEVEPTHPVVKRDPRSRAPAPKLPPTPPVLPLSADKPVNRTLNARDPRLSRAIGKQEPEVPAIKHKPVEIHPPKEEKMWEPPSRDKEKKMGQPTYKLHTVTVMPLNYSSYLFATQNDTKLLEDPRLKKLLSGTTPPRPMASLPFPPELQQFLEQGEAKQPKQSPPSSTPLPPPPPPQPTQPTNLILASSSGPVQKSDPRLKRNLPQSAQSPAHSGGFTPPHPATPLMDMPPNLMSPSGGFTPPTPPINPMMDMPNPLMMGFPPPGPPRPMNPMMDMGHMGMMHGPPMLHTHMPRGFIDPRFARLQQPMNPRRGRGNIRHQGPPRKMHRDGLHRPPMVPETKTIEPQECETDKNQRKKQMDYSSPLSAYDEGTPSEGSAYNRRPQQNTRTSTLAATVASTTPPPPPMPVPQANIPINKTDMSAETMEMPTEDLNAASLRDVFKTIDPTASPFC